jgi:L-ribulose-5-phosphate 3-epimerase
MTNRREFIKLSAIGAAAALLPQNDLSASPLHLSAAQLRKAVLISMLPKEINYHDRFKMAVDAGFEGIEAQTITDPREADEIKEASIKAKIPIHSVMNMGHWEWPLSSPDSEVNPQTTYMQAWERSQPQIRKLIPLAKDLGVVIAIEEVWNKFLLSAPDMARYVDDFKSPWIKAYFDVGNVVMYGFPEEWIRTLGKRIVKFHLKDFNTKTRQFVPLFEGSIDWKEVRKAIGEIGYSGFLTVELSPKPEELKDGHPAYLREVSKRVDKIFAGE